MLFPDHNFEFEEMFTNYQNSDLKLTDWSYLPDHQRWTHETLLFICTYPTYSNGQDNINRYIMSDVRVRELN